MFKAFSYVASFGAGFVGSHYLRNKMMEREPLNRSDVKGDDKSIKTRALDLAEMTQSFAPLQGIHLHMCGMHTYSGENNRQVPAHHYCSCINEDMNQCLIYDSDQVGARLIGVEYVISEKLFKDLPAEEKTLWHSHIYEIKSGLLFCPGMPEVAEKALMSKLINTYGKTFHLWQIDKGDDLPYGIPQLMMSMTGDGQPNKETIQYRNKYSPSLTQSKIQRLDIKEPIKDKLADNWENGTAVVLKTVEIPSK